MFLFYDLEKSRFGSRLHGDYVYSTVHLQYWDLGSDTRSRVPPRGFGPVRGGHRGRRDGPQHEATPLT